jgi:hypothetical protein
MTYSSTNTYFNIKAGRTYHALYVYYRPLSYYNAIGYYSSIYLMIYYNGYGYNFYYGKYGYYENSPNDMENNTGTIIGALVTFCCIFPILYCIVCKYCGEDEDIEESVEERVEVATHTTTLTHNQNNGGNNSDYDSSDADDKYNSNAA